MGGGGLKTGLDTRPRHARQRPGLYVWLIMKYEECERLLILRFAYVRDSINSGPCQLVTLFYEMPSLLCGVCHWGCVPEWGRGARVSVELIMINMNTGMAYIYI